MIIIYIRTLILIIKRKKMPLFHYILPLCLIILPLCLIMKSLNYVNIFLGLFTVFVLNYDYFLPKRLCLIIESLNYVNIYLILFTVFVVNIYDKVVTIENNINIINNNMTVIEKLFHKKCKNIKLIIDAGEKYNHDSVSKLNESIQTLETKINKINEKVLNLKNINEEMMNNKMISLKKEIEEIKSILSTEKVHNINCFTKLDKYLENLNKAICDSIDSRFNKIKKESDELLNNRLFFLLKEEVEEAIKKNNETLLNEIDIVRCKVDEAYSQINSL